MNLKAMSIEFLAVAFLLTPMVAAQQQRQGMQGQGAVTTASRYMKLGVSTSQPQLLALSVDSLGRGRFRPSALRLPPPPPRPTVARRSDGVIEYRATGTADAPARWTFCCGEAELELISRWSEGDPPEPVVLEFDPEICHATLLGQSDKEGGVRLPAVLHLPDQGTFRITTDAAKGVTLGCDAHRAARSHVRITFPPATRDQRQVTYRWEVVAIHPPLAGIEKDRRFDGFRRDWLNIFQLNPRLRVLANHASSDTCALIYYQYADIARCTPPLAEGLSALDLIRQSLDRVLAGVPTYGMPGFAFFDRQAPSEYPLPSLDTYPSLLVAAADYVAGSHDQAWLAKNYSSLRQWAENMLATDRDGNGLLEYHLSGNSGSWPPVLKIRPANWWDEIGFAHEDAYANALAYRALGCMERLARSLRRSEDAARYRAAAEKLHAAYFKTFYNPATGVLAGWKSADGKLHDYYFLFVNGIAIHYGLVPREQANAIMDRLLAKMREVGYNRFDLGLPGNLVPIAKDYAAALASEPFTTHSKFT